MSNEKRNVRAYKIADKPYLKALKKAVKEKCPLATVLEKFVTEYGNNDMTVQETVEYLKNLK